MKEFSKTSLKYLIGAIYFLVPVFFSHILKVLGFPVVFGSSSYERIKVELFYVLLLIIIPFWILSPFSEKVRDIFGNKKIALGSLVFLGILGVSTILSIDTRIAFFGGMEKIQGTLFFIAIWIFCIILRTLPEIYHRFFIKISFASFLCVLFYATMQWVGLDQLGSRYSLEFSDLRVFSTLGNPNYLAGYFVLFLPFVEKIVKTRAMRNMWYGLILFGILISGSLMGIGIALGYVIMKLLSVYKTKKIYILSAIVCSIVGIIAIAPIIPVDKLGSAEHRVIIWKTGILATCSNPERFLFGYGPEQFLETFPRFLPKKDAHYFSNDTPDRVHNIFLDILFSFGIIGLGAFVTLLVFFFRAYPISQQSSQVVLLFLVFFSFNIPVLVHFLMVGLAVSRKDENIRK